MLKHAIDSAGSPYAWSWDPGVLIGLGIIAALYVNGLVRSRDRWPRFLSNWQPIAFFAGLAAVFAALISPVAELAHALLFMHMVQHLLLMLVAAPLLLAGAPVFVLLRGLPSGFRRTVASPLARNRGLRQFANMLTSPVVAWTVYGVNLIAWHFPGAYSLALNNSAVHALEHLCFFGTALLFWWVVIDPAPFKARASHPVRVLYLFLAMVPSNILGAMLTFAAHTWYEPYTMARRVWGISAESDQQVGGLLMWVPGGIVFLAGAAVVFLAWFESEERKERAARNTP
ncbi:MAG: cytochrome c oxidase assembly protein [Chloroflexi bacterium]|nr:cytochrome c oxidase assembly protein [Chloroflexota bacterium]